MKITETAKARGPAVTAGIDTKPTPLATGISPNVRAQLPKLGTEKARRVKEFVARKASEPHG